MDTIAIEDKMAMKAVGAPAEAKTEMAGAHLPPPVPVSVAPSKAEERYVNNTSHELVMIEPHYNLCDDRPNNNDSLDRVIQTGATKEVSAENMGSGQGNQLWWTIYSGYTELLPVPMIPPSSS